MTIYGFGREYSITRAAHPREDANDQGLTALDRLYLLKPVAEAKGAGINFRPRVDLPVGKYRSQQKS